MARRRVRPSIDELLAAARARFDRVESTELRAEMAAGALVVDTRLLFQWWLAGRPGPSGNGR